MLRLPMERCILDRLWLGQRLLPQYLAACPSNTVSRVPPPQILMECPMILVIEISQDRPRSLIHA